MAESRVNNNEAGNFPEQSGGTHLRRNSSGEMVWGPPRHSSGRISSRTSTRSWWFPMPSLTVPNQFPFPRSSKDQPQSEPEPKPIDEDSMETKHDIENKLVQALDDKTKELRDVHANREKWMASYQQMRDQYKNQLQTRDAEIARLHLNVKELSENLTKMKKDRETLQDQILLAQEGAFRSMKEASWIPKEDRKVRDDLSKLEERIRSWVKRYAVAEISALGHISNAERDTIVQQLKGYCAYDEWDSLVKSMRPGLEKRMAALFINAMLAKDIFEKIFASPFSGFPVNDENSTIPSVAKMSYLYQSMMQVDKTEGHVWRSQMLRLLTSPPIDSATDALLPNRMKEKGNKLATEFLNGPARLLFREDVDQGKREQDLQLLYHSAGELSLSLWAQRSSMRCYSLKYLEVFSRDNAFMTAHRLHHLDEDDDRLNGKKVLAVIQPAIVAYGNEDAENYDRSKVWAKAVVLIDESA